MVEAVIENMANGIRFRLGDIVETVKGAKFWGEIIALDTDDASPGCTVIAVDPGFEGTKHFYPLKQLRHRVKVHTGAIEALLLFDAYHSMPVDRGGSTGPRGKAWQAFLAAKAEALAAYTPGVPDHG